MSGVVPGLAHYQIGMGPQYEGFGYVGAGILLLLFAGLPHAVGCGVGRATPPCRADRRRRGELPVCAVQSGLPGQPSAARGASADAVLRLFGLLRSSGRFVWLPAYAIMAGSIVLALQAEAVLGDDRPVPGRRDIADRRRRAAARRDRGCGFRSGPCRVGSRSGRRAGGTFARDRGVSKLSAASMTPLRPATTPLRSGTALTQANMEIQLIAARADLPINSVYQFSPADRLRAEACSA